MYIRKIRNFFRKMNVIMLAVIAVGVISGTTIFAMEVQGHSDPFVDMEKSVLVDITKKMEFTTPEDRVLGEAPVYTASTEVEVKNVPENIMDGYILKTDVKVYEDKACEQELTTGFTITVKDLSEELNGKHEVEVTLTPDDASLAGKQVYVKLFAELQKIGEF